MPSEEAPQGSVPGNKWSAATDKMSSILHRQPRQMSTPETTWSPAESARTRVLLECSPHNSPTVVATALDHAGFDVVICEGPADHQRCPVACGDYCAAVQAADVVVNMLDTGTPATREVLGAVVDSGPRRPPIVAMVDRPDQAPAGVHTIGRRSTANELVQAINDALESANQPGAAWGDGV